MIVATCPAPKPPSGGDLIVQFLMAALAAAAIVILANACAGEPIYSRGSLLDQELHPAPGRPGIWVNQACLERSGDRCVRMDILDYDLRDAGVRERLRGVELICDVAGTAFAVCPDRPGFCHREAVVTKRLVGIPIKRELRILRYLDAVADHRTFLDAGAYCAAQKSVSGRLMFR